MKSDLWIQKLGKFSTIDGPLGFQRKYFTENMTIYFYKNYVWTKKYSNAFNGLFQITRRTPWVSTDREVSRDGGTCCLKSEPKSQRGYTLLFILGETGTDKRIWDFASRGTGSRRSSG